MYSNILKKEFHFEDIGHERLNVYRLAYKLAMEIFQISKAFPKEEMYSLTDQVRRSSRSVSANIGEGYRKRIYPKSFVSKMIEVDGEATETVIHLRFAHDCGYITHEEYRYFRTEYMAVGQMINGMVNHPEKFTPVGGNKSSGSGSSGSSGDSKTTANDTPIDSTTATDTATATATATTSKTNTK